LCSCVYFFTFLKTKGKYKHRGEVLQTTVHKSPLKITELVKRMNISRGTYYNHIADPDLSFETLEQYGKVLAYDFTNDFSEMQKYTLEEPGALYGEPSTLEEATRQRDYWRSQTDLWKNKYIQLLEEMKGR
jgi:hypothetical protein